MREIYTNARVYTGDGNCSAFVCEDGRFLYAGDNEGAMAYKTENTPAYDLEGAFVCAGFNDSHMHLLSYGEYLTSARLSEHTRSVSDMISYMRDFLRGHPTEAWLYGRGWNQDYFEDEHRYPTRHDMDKVSTETPICAVRACGHCLVVNSKVLELLHITAETECPDGGSIGMTDGEPNGLFFDNAMSMVYAAIPSPDKDRVKAMLRTAMRELNTYGVTSCQTDDYSFKREIPYEIINEAYRELAASGEMTVRVYEQSNFTSLSDLRGFVEAGNLTGVGDEYFRIGPLKMLGDGALGAHTAYLSEPYADAPETRGLPVFTEEVMDEMISYANAHDMQVAVHAIGDGCLDRVLNAIEKALAENPHDDHRHGIVHCQITRPDQLRRITELKLHVYAQSIFLDYDNHIVVSRVGKERAETSYNWKTLMRGGVSVSNGTDCPVEMPFALGGIQCAVTRASLKGDRTPYLPREAFSVREAIDS